MPTAEQTRTTGAWPMVEHAFTIAPRPANPFAAPLWAVVQRPSGNELPVSRIAIPAFYDGGDIWRIRYRPDRLGSHHIVAYISGEDIDSAEDIAVTTDESREFSVEGEPTPGYVRLCPSNVQRFVFDNGDAYFPIGYNVAWESVNGYREHFRQMKGVGLNWSRVWMAHWAGMNLDWVMGKSIAEGELDLDVARRWDAIVAAAEENGIKFQFVLQHHGQVSTWINSNWSENPWNVANGGWLHSPSHFFTDEKARSLTRDKYRYIIARWGHSPSIMAWELFNEVELTDGYVERGLREVWELADRHGNFAPRLDTGIPAIRDDADVELAQAEQGVLGKLAETWNAMSGAVVKSLGPGSGHRQVAQWHSDMATHIRSIDPTGRLVTTSSAPRESLIWRDMDYYQLHLYHREMIAPLARIPSGVANYDKPVFVGEMGDHEILDPDKGDGRHMAPMIWAGLFSGAAGAAQAWAWDTIDQHGLLGDFQAMTRFIREAQIPERNYQPADIRVYDSADSPAIVALSMMAPDSLILWLYHPESIAVNDPPLLSTRVILPDEARGTAIDIRWFDTKTGEFMETSIACDGTQEFIVSPMFANHVAAIVTPSTGQSFRRSR